MDSFAKALQKGLAKTVAVGQQHLQQRLSKYDQHKTNANAAGSTYGTGHQAQAQYAHGNQGQYPTPAEQSSSYHSAYFPPPPGSSQPPYQPYAQQHSSSYGQGQHAPAVHTPAPSTVQSYSSAPGTPAAQAVHHGHSYQPPPLPPRPTQQPPVNGYHPSSHGQNASYGPRTQNAEGLPSAAASTQQAYSTPYRQTAPPVSSPTTYPLPPRVNQQQQGGNYGPHPDYSQATSYRPPEQGHPSAKPVEPAQNPYQLGTTYTAPFPAAQQQRNETIAHPAAHTATWESPSNTQPPPASANTTSPQQYQSVAETSSSAPAAQTNQNIYGTTVNTNPYHLLENKHGSAAAFPSAPTQGQDQAGTAQYHHQPQNDAASMAQQMNNLSINGNPAASSDNIRGPLQTTRPKLPPIVASGSPRDIVQHCPEDRIVEYALYWYHLPDAPEFLICTRCHEDHIQGTPLAGQFRRVLAERGSPSICRFWCPRVKDCLWKQALQRNDLDGLRAHAARRPKVPNCKGKEATVGKDGIKYYGMRNNDINGFITCEACYEDKIIGTAFESSFTPRDGQGAEDKWICDMNPAYVSRALARFADKNNWAGFIEGATRRLQLPVCEGASKPASEGPWYILRRKIDNVYACATCYMDKLALTAFEGEFEAVNQNVGFDAWMEMLGQRWICDFTSSSLGVLVALETALHDDDFDGFWETARIISKLVPCTAKGIVRGNWWTVSGGCENFGICEACYVGAFKTKGLDRFFEPANLDPEATLVCSFCPATPRFRQFASKYLEVLDRGVFSDYADCVRKFASVAPCPGINHRENAKWWGYPDALFCEDCYVGFVADTRLAAHVPIKGESDQRAQICQVWSPRMRAMWTEACAAGEPGSDASNEQVARFRAFGEKRLQVYLQTVPRIKFIKEMREMKMMNAMHQGQLSLMYSGMNSMAVLSDTTDGNLHGNSSLGWYETEHGATGAKLFNDMQSGFANANRTDEWAEIMRLQALWCEVE